jgi:hypothetical protein
VAEVAMAIASALKRADFNRALIEKDQASKILLLLLLFCIVIFFL